MERIQPPLKQITNKTDEFNLMQTREQKDYCLLCGIADRSWYYSLEAPRASPSSGYYPGGEGAHTYRV